MAQVYTPPGVSFTEEVSPNVNPLLAVPALPCLIGMSRGNIVRTDQFVITGTTAIPLPNLPTGATLVGVTTVSDAIDPTKGTNGAYTLTTDYTVSTSNGTITRVSGGGIADGSTINVTYSYLPIDYFAPIRLDDMGAIESRFGSAYTADGTGINSPLSFAAGCAFENGAGAIVLQPLFARSTPGDANTAQTQPTSTQAATLSTWADTLQLLRNYEDINLIVPVIGQSAPNVGDAVMLQIEQAVQDHIYFMGQQNQYIVSVFGEDATPGGGVGTPTALQTHAQNLASRYSGSVAENIAMVSPGSFQRVLPTTGKYINVGGQYVAASICGLLASTPTFTPLTRRQISGYTSVNSVRTKSQKDSDAQSGLIVVEQKGYAVQIRHAITLDNTSAATRELSVVRSKHRMIESVRSTLDTQIVGKIVADEHATLLVEATVIGVLESLLVAREVVNYGGVAARITSLDPTTIEVRFSYKPSFPINYINVRFAIDLTNGTDTVSTTPTSTFAGS